VSATPTVAATNFVAERLLAEPALAGVAVYVQVAPQEKTRPRRDDHDPYVTVRPATFVDQRVVGGRVVASEIGTDVLAWDDGTDVGRLAPIVAAIHAALHRTRQPVPSPAAPYVSACSRVAAQEFAEVDGNNVFTALGGRYAVRVANP
jgi:hypothetical protein